MLFSVLCFVLVPFLFYIRFPLVVVLFFAVLFFVVFGCFFRAFFRAFCGVFFVSFIVLFFVHFFVLFLVFFFEFFFFRALGGTRDKQPQYFAFWPVLFSVLFLVVTTSEDRIYTIYTQNMYTMVKDWREPICFAQSWFGFWTCDTPWKPLLFSIGTNETLPGIETDGGETTEFLKCLRTCAGRSRSGVRKERVITRHHLCEVMAHLL